MGTVCLFFTCVFLCGVLLLNKQAELAFRRHQPQGVSSPCGVLLLNRGVVYYFPIVGYMLLLHNRAVVYYFPLQVFAACPVHGAPCVVLYTGREALCDVCHTTLVCGAP